MSLSRTQTEDLLDRIEASEDPLLSWGVVDGGLSFDELEELVDSFIQQHDPFLNVADVIQQLLNQGLLHRHEQQGGELYRSRIGEGIRLLARLRQLFHTGGHETGWQGAATLVGGFRYVRRPRRYPRRDVEPVELLGAKGQLGRLAREVGMALTDGLRLSGFQIRATDQILEDAKAAHSRGVIVGAGTGSGKTLAFYLPALMLMSDLIDENHWTKVVALYPRNELLKDQLQSAVEHAQQIRELLRQQRGRPLRVGVLFGDVPQNLSALRNGRYRSWKKRGDAYVCPYLRCPSPAMEAHPENERFCHGDLMLTTESGEGALRCASCGSTLSSAEFVITRAQLRNGPPDLLFCSTEMLNRGLLDQETGHVMGIGARNGPRLVLLDEVHTYGGTTGAMAAIMLRRWRARLRSKPAFVGLSATLVDAGPFFADLVGLDEDKVAYVRPDDDELIPEGAEYLLAVRSDPVSGAGVLSTTIQTAMLLGRIMDPAGTDKSMGLFGQKVFCFTDDLDVTNRLYFDLLDAEGQRARRWGDDIPVRPSLAHLRAPSHGDNPARRSAGQLWELPADLGHDLSDSGRLGVERTSSQDAGVDTRKTLVVATSSLEVGFDDPTVGAVIQHKAPRDIASFLQRHGRAGRTRGMRPVTAVILSDYGRDRQAYEGWDRLFDPVLPPRHLPVRNVHVLRMQATMATLEWVAQELSLSSGNMWQDLAGPNPRGDKWGNAARQRQQSVARVLKDLIASEDLQRELRVHLQSALHLGPAAIDDLLWHPPRAVLLAAVPSLLRRLETGWSAVHQDVGAVGQVIDAGAPQPLPEFIPQNLFSALALPEVVLELPVGPPAKEEIEHEPIGLVQGLRELAPGRVSRRFAVVSELDRHWTPASEAADGSIDIATFVPTWRREASLTIRGAEGPVAVPLLRPMRLTARRPPDNIRSSSNARPTWRSQLVPAGQGVDIPPVTSDPVGQLVDSFTAFLHRDHAEVEARRGCLGSEARLIFEGGRDLEVTTRYAQGAQPVALGGVFDVDGLRACVRIAIPADVWSTEQAPGLRSAWFHHVMTTDDALRSHANPFLLNWLHDVVATALLSETIAERSALPDAWDAVRVSLHDRLEAALEILLAAPGLRIDDVGVDTGPARLHDNLSSLLSDDTIITRLDTLTPVLWERPEEDAAAWLNRRVKRTFGEAMLAAATMLCPAHDPEGVVVEVEPGFDGDRARIDEVWLTETSIGGGGFLEAVAEAMSRDPVRFQRLVRTSLRPSPDQRIGGALRRVLAAALGDTPVAPAFARYRASSRMDDRITALADVRDALSQVGVPPLQDTVAAVANRLLRPGSDASTDAEVHASLERWLDVEKRLGIEVEVRTWCFLDATREGSLDRGLLERLQLVMWPRGWRLRASGLSSYNPFCDEVPAVPELLDRMLSGHDPVVVDLDGAPGAEEKVLAALRADALVEVRVEAEHPRRLAAFLARTVVTPVDLEYLQLHPRLAEVRVGDEDGSITARLELSEAV